ncbi:MAG: hypothetical protein ACOYON_07125 [Fimbriimonas sp.]
MLETPLYGRFQGENRRLFFGPPEAYLVLMRGVFVAGGALLVAPPVFGLLGQPLPLFEAWYLLVGTLLLVAGALAWLSLVRAKFDLKERVFTRWLGGSKPPVRGKLQDLDALVLISEPKMGGVTYHLVLHWRERRLPPMVVQQDTRAVAPGQPLNASAGPIAQLGLRYAQALGVRFFDNAHFASPNPIQL